MHCGFVSSPWPSSVSASVNWVHQSLLHSVGLTRSSNKAICVSERTYFPENRLQLVTSCSVKSHQHSSSTQAPLSTNQENMNGWVREGRAQRDEMTRETDGWGRSAQARTPACSFFSCSHLDASCNSDTYSDVWVFQHHQAILQH